MISDRPKTPKQLVLIEVERTADSSYPWAAWIGYHLVLGWTEASVKRQARRYLRRKAREVPRHEVEIEL